MSRCAEGCKCRVCEFRRTHGVTVCPPATEETASVYRIVLRDECLGSGVDPRLHGDGTCYQCGERFAVRATVIVEGKRREFCGEKCLADYQRSDARFCSEPT